MVEPDILVVDADAPGPDLLRVAPLLVVEVTSPSTRGEDLGRKVHAYAEGGAPWYWIADLRDDTLTVHRLGAAGSAQAITAHRGAPLRLDEPFPVLRGPGSSLRLTRTTNSRSSQRASRPARTSTTKS